MAGLFSSLWGRGTTRRDAPARNAVRSSEDVIADFERGQAIPDDLVDAFLDGEVAPDRHSALFAALRREPDAHVKLDETERAIDALRDGGEAPDFTRRILGEVHRRRGLLDCAGLRRVSIMRWSLAACVILTATAFFVARRSAPEVVTFTPVVAPINDLVHALPGETTGAIVAARTAFESVRQISPGAVEPEPCSMSGKVCCDEPCHPGRLMVAPAPVLDTRLLLSSWLESVQDISAFAVAPAPSQRGRVRTMQAAWTPASGRIGGELPRISVRTLLLEPGRVEQSEEADRLLTAPRR